MRRALSALVATGCLLTGFSELSLAQGTPGFTLFGGPDRQYQLGFRLDSGQPDRIDRYRLRIPAKKMELAIAQLTISYPDYYDGEFDPERIEVRVGQGRRAQTIPLQDVVWDAENYRIDIYPQEPIPAGNNVEVVLSNVQNPAWGGMYYFNCQIQSPGDVPLLRYLGTWVLMITS